jgi:hypothetical protein
VRARAHGATPVTLLDPDRPRHTSFGKSNRPWAIVRNYGAHFFLTSHAIRGVSHLSQCHAAPAGFMTTCHVKCVSDFLHDLDLARLARRTRDLKLMRDDFVHPWPMTAPDDVRVLVFIPHSC